MSSADAHPSTMEAADSVESVGFRTSIPAIHRLTRTVAALPLHRFMSLNQAFTEAKGCLGSGDLAARDLRQHARDRRLTIAARRIFPDGTEQVLIFRSAYWRYFTILPPYRDSEVVLVRGPITFPGAWYCFVGRRRFGRLYSSQPALEPSPQAPSESTTTTPRPGSADFWIDELFPNETWRQLKPKRIHRAIEQEINKRNTELVQNAKSRNEKATLLEHVSLTAVRDALKRRA